MTFPTISAGSHSFGGVALLLFFYCQFGATSYCVTLCFSFRWERGGVSVMDVVQTRVKVTRLIVDTLVGAMSKCPHAVEVLRRALYFYACVA